MIERDAGVFSVPSKVLSYFCAGRPVLLAAPAENLVARTVKAQDCGLVVEPEDNAGWLAAARSLLDNANDRTRMGGASRAYAEANFVLETVTDRFEAVFAAALADPRRPASRKTELSAPAAAPTGSPP